jgi:hypothetical protein
MKRLYAGFQIPLGRSDMDVLSRSRSRTIGVILCLILLSGCTKSATDLNVIPVTGQVTYDGRPIEGANVIFSPVDRNQTLASQAVTDQEGRFEMRTHTGGGKFESGIAPGNYTVAITKLDTSAISTTLAPPKDVLPKKYGIPQTSGLTAEVAEGKENDFEFALKSK